MGGGHATHSGIRFQDQVAAWFAVHAISDEPVHALGLPADFAPTYIAQETASAVDDTVVGFPLNACCFVNSKKRIPLSASANSELASVIGQFVAQWRNLSNSDEETLRHSRLVLAVPPSGTQKLVSASRAILERIANIGQLEPRKEIATNQTEERAFDHWIQLTRQAMSSAGFEVTDANIVAMFRRVRIMVFDFDSSAATTALNLLRRSVLEDPTQAEAAWSELTALALTMGAQRIRLDRTQLRRRLIDHGFSLHDLPEFAQDIQRLRDLTTETLTSLRHLSVIDAPTETGNVEIHITRDFTQKLLTQAASSTFLLIGEPGSGKSACLYRLAQQLIESGRATLTLAVDQHLVQSIAQWQHEIGLSRPLLQVLDAWQSNGPGTVIIDALDATRGNPAERVFEELIRYIIESMPTWNVVATIRRFDLMHGQRFRRLFAGSPTIADYSDPEFPSVRHFLIPQLTKEEIHQALQCSTPLNKAFHNGRPAFRDLLCSPFNLYLLAGVLHTRPDANLTNLSNTVGLLDEFWDARICDPPREKGTRESALETVLEAMMQCHTMSLSMHLVSDQARDGVEQLLSLDVLRPTKQRCSQVFEFSLSHHYLFDYAIARLILGGGIGAQFLDVVANANENILLFAPSIRLALRMAWEINPQPHSDFWTTALHIAECSNLGTFLRRLPTDIAAESLIHRAEADHLINALKSNNKTDIENVRFIAMHCIASIVASDHRTIGDAAPEWTSVIREFAETDISGLSGPIRIAVNKWLEQPKQPTKNQLTDLGQTSRLLLQHGLQAPATSSDVSVGLKGTVRTYETNPEKSHALLQTVLDPNRISRWGYEELFPLATQFDHLLTNCPNILADLYRVAYCTPLPSRDEITQLGNSRIIPLSSNKRQDFETFQYYLENRFARFVTAYPTIACTALFTSLHCWLRNNHEFRAERSVPFIWNGNQTKFFSDYSLIWWDVEKDSHYESGTQLLNQFVEALVLIAREERDTDLDQILSLVAFEGQLACLWIALTRAGTQQPTSLGRKLLPFIHQQNILSTSDVSHPIALLICSLHPILTPTERAELEEIVVAIPDDHYRSSVLAGLETKNIELDSAKTLHSQYETNGELNKSTPPFRTHVSRRSGTTDEWEWLRHKGIETKTKSTSDVLNLVNKLREFTALNTADSKQRNRLHSNWRLVQKLHAKVTETANLERMVLELAYHEIAHAASNAAKSSDKTLPITKFFSIREFIFESLMVLPDDASENGADREAQFENNNSWSTPAPRIEATQALMAYVRALGRTDESIRSILTKLSSDPNPAVRYQVFSRINMLFNADPEFTWKVIDRGFDIESNRLVLAAFLKAVERVCTERAEWTEQRLAKLEQRIADADTRGGEYFLRNKVFLNVSLWLNAKHPIVQNRVFSWADDPVRYSQYICEVINSLKEILPKGTNEQHHKVDAWIREQALAFYDRAADHATARFLELATMKHTSDNQQRSLENPLRVADAITHGIYFNSGAHDTRKKSQQSVCTEPELKEFLSAFEPTLRTLAGFPYPAITHYVLETLEHLMPASPSKVFTLVIEVLDAGGKAGGYAFESMGVDTFLRIVKRFIADFRNELSGNIELQQGLVRALDMFVESGSMEARKLANQLPEFMR